MRGIIKRRLGLGQHRQGFRMVKGFGDNNIFNSVIISIDGVKAFGEIKAIKIIQFE